MNKTQSLLNEYEALNSVGRDVSTEFGKLIEEFLQTNSRLYSTVELEYILIGEITGKLAEIRLTKALALKRALRNVL
jgi:hypothetical protein